LVAFVVLVVLVDFAAFATPAGGADFDIAAAFTAFAALVDFAGFADP
jgi:hypothetical protein